MIGCSDLHCYAVNLGLLWIAPGQQFLPSAEGSPVSADGPVEICKTWGEILRYMWIYEGYFYARASTLRDSPGAANNPVEIHKIWKIL